MSDLHDPQHPAAVAIKLDLSLAGHPNGPQARELELATDVIAGQRQQRFADRVGIRQPPGPLPPGDVYIYMEKRWRDLLTLALDRFYVLRGQIVHGAATRGSSLNRAVLKQCSQVLEGLLPQMPHLAIEHGAHDNSPPLCYPSVYEEGPPAGRRPPARRAR
ncbi:MAG TPA: hypothetical protein VGY55_07610 [Pirellulales bacterium]|jgi:hypothetical protein|nr:hypothetical protein [Pirellulales bacterium]